MKISCIPGYSPNSFKGKIKIEQNKYIDTRDISGVTTSAEGNIFINHYGILGGLKAWRVPRKYSLQQVNAAVERVARTKDIVDLSPTETSTDSDTSFNEPCEAQITCDNICGCFYP